MKLGGFVVVAIVVAQLILADFVALVQPVFLRPQLVGVRPQGGVPEGVVEVGEDEAAGGDVVLADGGVGGGAVQDADRVDVGQPDDLVHLRNKISQPIRLETD